MNTFNHNEKDIQYELISNNSWMRDGINLLYKFPNKNIIKIQFRQSLVAKKATEKKMLCFRMSISSYSLYTEEYIPITICMKCYELDTHITNKCSKGKEYQICSECSSQRHTWRECSSTIKICINCQGNHRTLAYKCPEKRSEWKKNKEAK